MSDAKETEEDLSAQTSVLGNRHSRCHADQRTSSRRASETRDKQTMDDTESPARNPDRVVDPISIPYPTVKDGLPVSSTVARRNRADAPLLKLSVDLIKTYKRINQVYYQIKKEKQAEEKAKKAAEVATEEDVETLDVASTDSKKQQKWTGLESAKEPDAVVYNDGYDDENYDYKIKLQESLNGRYVVRQRIGKGSFGQVVRAFDEQEKQDVAVKIIKSKKPFFRQAKTEIELLQELNSKDPSDQWFIVRLRDTFIHHNHQCLVFEMLSYNLYDLLRNTQFLGISLNLLRKFARQILKSLHFLSRSDVNIIHCDLKPENILLRHSKRSAIKIIDFGSSCKTNRRLYSYIQSRFYRSPEVMLGRKYTVAIDMWSLGCILMEMHTGEPLFSGTDEHDQMLRLVAIRGMPSDSFLESSPKVYHFFERAASKGTTDVGWKIKPRRKGSNVDASIAQHRKTLEQILGLNGKGPAERRKAEDGHTVHHYQQFTDFIKRMLVYDPEKRIKPKEALNHPFLKVESSRHKKSVPRNPTVAVEGPNESSDRGLYSNNRDDTSRKMVRRPGSAPAAAKFSNTSRRKVSRVANQNAKLKK